MTGHFDLMMQWGPQGPMGPQHPMGPHWGAGGSMMPWGGTASGGLGFLWSMGWLVLLVAVIVLGAYLAYRVLNPQEPRSTTDPLDILRMRYAQGEIDEAEFERRRAQLLGGPSR